MSARPHPQQWRFGRCLSLLPVLAIAVASASVFAQDPAVEKVAEPETPMVVKSDLAETDAGDATPEQTTAAGPVSSSEPPADPEPVSEGAISEDIEALKQQLLTLNRDLLILEEELLYPANSQLALYLSMDVGTFFQLDSVEVKLDDKLIVSELYSDHQVSALYRGGVQRLHLGNLRTGTHTLTAFFVGIGPQGREYKRAAELTFDKETSGKVFELQIVDSAAKLQPVFDIKEWQL